MLNEERKFITYERIRRTGKFNMVTDWQVVLRYAKKYFNIDISKDEYLEIIENYSLLREQFLK